MSTEGLALLHSYKLEDIIAFEKRDGYYYIKFKVNIIELEVAKRLVAFRFEVTNLTSSFFLIDARSIRKQNKDAVLYLEGEGAKYMLSTAIVLSNFNSMFSNLALLILHKKVDCKAFNSERKAEDWLLNKISNSPQAK